MVVLYGGSREPVGLIKPTPLPVKTPTLSGGCGFLRVGVRASLENPRVARDNPYSKQGGKRKKQIL